jgi:hypothetical protein
MGGISSRYIIGGPKNFGGKSRQLKTPALGAGASRNYRVFNFEGVSKLTWRSGFETSKRIEGLICCVKLSVERRTESDGRKSREKGNSSPSARVREKN